MEIKGKTKRYAVDPSSNAGVSVGDEYASLVGDKPKSFVTAHEDQVTISGKKLNLLLAPGQMKLMGGLFKLNGFPMAMLPSTVVTPQPMMQLDPSIITTMVETATSVVGMLATIV